MFGKMVSFILAQQDLYTQRRALSRMTAENLADVGLTFDQAQLEANRSGWDIPTSGKTTKPAFAKRSAKVRLSQNV